VEAGGEGDEFHGGWVMGELETVRSQWSCKQQMVSAPWQRWPHLRWKKEIISAHGVGDAWVTALPVNYMVPGKDPGPCILAAREIAPSAALGILYLLCSGASSLRSPLRRRAELKCVSGRKAARQHPMAAAQPALTSLLLPVWKVTAQ